MGIIDTYHEIVRSFAESVFISVIKEDRYETLVEGLWMSLQLTAMALVIGLFIGVLIAIAKLQDVDAPARNVFTRELRKWIVGFANGYVSVIRGTPTVVQLLVIYLVVFGRLFQGHSIEAHYIAGLAFGINSGAYIAEIIRAGIMAVDKGQKEAGRSLGLSGTQTMVLIIIPQAIKNVLPALVNELIVLFKETSIAGYIGIIDLTKGAQSIGSAAYSFMVPLLCAAYIYFLTTTVLSAGMNKLERRLHRGD